MHTHITLSLIAQKCTLKNQQRKQQKKERKCVGVCSSKPFVCLHLCFSYNLFLFQFHRTDKHFVANATCAQVQDNTDCDSGKIQQRKKTPNFFENSKWSRLLFTQKRIHSQIPSRIHWKRHWNQHESFTVILFTINMEIDMQINYQLQLDRSQTHTPE